MLDFIINASILVIAIFLVTYFTYCLGLFFVLKKLNTKPWQAFIPVLNYKALITAVGLPLRWFGYSLIPYTGAIYSVAIAERLGKIFNKSFAFSALWLTIGAPVGMNIIGFSKIKPNLAITESSAPNLKELSKRLKKLKNKNKT